LLLPPVTIGCPLHIIIYVDQDGQEEGKEKKRKEKKKAHASKRRKLGWLSKYSNSLVLICSFVAASDGQTDDKDDGHNSNKPIHSLTHCSNSFPFLHQTAWITLLLYIRYLTCFSSYSLHLEHKPVNIGQ